MIHSEQHSGGHCTYLLDHNLAAETELRTAYQAEKDGDRRLPWSLIDNRLDDWDLSPLE